MEVTATFPVLVKISSNEIDEHGRPENGMQLLMSGDIQLRNDGGWVLHYEESIEDESDHTAITHDVRLLVREGRVTMLRKGPYSMMLVLEQGRAYESAYHTPFGDMKLSVMPVRVHTAMAADKGLIRLQYQMSVSGGMAAMHRIEIEYTARRGTSVC